MKDVLIWMSFLFFGLNCFSQGGRSDALGKANVVLEDELSVFNNLAGTAKIKKASVVCSYNNRFNLASLNTVSAGLLIPIKLGVITSDISRYGNNLYSESYIGLGFSHDIQNVSLGIKASYLQHHIEEYGTRGVFVLEFGGIAQLIPNLFFGAHIYNPNQAKIAKEGKEKLPVIMKSGLGFKPMEKLLLITEVEKGLEYPSRFKGGIEYNIIKYLFLRTGIATNPVNNSFGFGLWLRKVKIDYALNSFQRIGFQHSISLSYNINEYKIKQ